MLVKDRVISRAQNRIDSRAAKRMLGYSAIEENQIAELREIAAAGILTAALERTLPAQRHALSGAAFAVAWPVVYQRLTRGVERRRGHGGCASSVFQMTQDCLDRFYDDVEAAVDDLLAHAHTPILSLEGWIASRLNASTVNAHRRRRGRVGALQRPRLPKWLIQALDHDPWLTELATQMLLWVGVSTTAGVGLWPLEAWALRRAATAGDRAGASSAAVARDVETVLAAMRTHREWHARYVERPLGHKQAPITSASAMADATPLLLRDRDDAEDAELTRRASVALRAIEARLVGREDPSVAIPEVIRTVFTGGARDLDWPPLTGPDYEHSVSAALRDPDQAGQVVATVLRILQGPVPVPVPVRQ